MPFGYFLGSLMACLVGFFLVACGGLGVLICSGPDANADGGQEAVSIGAILIGLMPLGVGRFIFWEWKKMS